jgi:hypothetical protein
MMTTQRLVWAASGLGFLACSAAGLLLATVFSSGLYPSPFGPPFGPQTDVATYFAANRAQVRGMSFVFTLAALFLLVFVACSAEMLADRGPARRSPLPGLALAAGTLSAGFWLLNALLLWVLSRPTPAAEPALLTTAHELTYLAGGPAHVLFLGVFLGAVSAALWRSMLLPRWVAWTGAVAAAAVTPGVLVLLWEPASFLLPVGRGLGMLWILATSVALLVGRSGEAMAASESRPDERTADHQRKDLAA